MTQQFVRDASATIAWLFKEPAAEHVAAVLEENAPVVPWLWRLEIVNAVLVRERRKALAQSDAAELLRLADALAVAVAPEPAGRSATRLAHLARPHQLTSYDAVYLELAIQRNLPLLTLDRNLRAAAERAGLSLL